MMLGYIRADAPGHIVPPEDGWYDTGDVVSIDDDGFIAIRGRLKRFAKIGGETVSLAVVENSPPRYGPTIITPWSRCPTPPRANRSCW